MYNVRKPQSLVCADIQFKHDENRALNETPRNEGASVSELSVTLLAFRHVGELFPSRV